MDSVCVSFDRPDHEISLFYCILPPSQKIHIFDWFICIPVNIGAQMIDQNQISNEPMAPVTLYRIHIGVTST